MTVSSASPFTSLDDLLNCATGGGTGPAQNIHWFKDGFIGNHANPSATVIGYMTSLWMWNGFPNCPNDVIPSSSWTNCHRLDTGSIIFSPPVSGKLWCIGMTQAPSNDGGLLLYDRLGNNGGLSGISTAQQVVSSSIDRYTGSACIGNQIYLEIYTAVGNTGTTINCTYINQNGQTSVTPTASFGVTATYAPAQRLIHLQLAPGDTGVQAVNSVILKSSTGTAGSFGVTLGHPILELPLEGGSTILGVRNALFDLPSIPQVQSNACLAFIWHPNSATTGPNIYGSIHLLEK